MLSLCMSHRVLFLVVAVTMILDSIQVLVVVFLVVVFRELPRRWVGICFLKAQIVDLIAMVDIGVICVLTFRHLRLLLVLLRIVLVLPVVLQRTGVQRVQNETVERKTRRGAPTWWRGFDWRHRRHRRML